MHAVRMRCLVRYAARSSLVMMSPRAAITSALLPPQQDAPRCAVEYRLQTQFHDVVLLRTRPRLRYACLRSRLVDSMPATPRDAASHATVRLLPPSTARVMRRHASVRTALTFAPNVHACTRRQPATRMSSMSRVNARAVAQTPC